MMKRGMLTYTLMVLVALLLTMCGGNRDTGHADSDTAAPVAEEEVLEEFTSPDLGLWHLDGPVSGAVFLSYEVADSAAMPDQRLNVGLDSITFSRDGLVTSMVSGLVEKGKLTLDSDLRFEYSPGGEFAGGTEHAGSERGIRHHVRLSRTSGGYLQVLQVLGPDDELSTSDSYIRLIEWSGGALYSSQTEDAEGTLRSSYTYNSDGLPEKVVSTISDMGGDTRIEEQYRYTAYDKYGNWTERRVLELTDITQGEADGTNMKTTHHTSHRLDRRRIYYYPPRAGASAGTAAPSGR